MEKTLATNEFVSRNNVLVCGKLISTIPLKDRTLFIICYMRVIKTELGNREYVKRIATVSFFGAEAEHYKETYKVGDFIVVNGIVQRVVRRPTKGYSVEIWGLSVNSKKIGERITRDCANVSMRGKIDSAVKINDNYILINVLTNVEKTRLNINTESEKKEFTDTYRSITPIGIPCRGNADDLIKVYTQGTWVDIIGTISAVKEKKEQKNFFKNRIIADKIKVIGNVQPLSKSNTIWKD